MRINPFVYGVLILVVFLGTILAFQYAGIWSISGKVSSSGGEITLTGADVNEIKGWMTLEDVATAYQIPPAEILAAFDLPGDTPGSTPLKEMETDTFSITELRSWIQEHPQP
jgi:hypothetical protein